MIVPGHSAIWNQVFSEPIPDEARQPASIDLRLADDLLLHPEYETGYQRTPQLLFPGDFILGSTMERIYIPPAYAGKVEGKSSWGRRGLIIHATAGFIDPGFEGVITLEMANISKDAIRLEAGMWIAQIALHQMLTTVLPEHLYKGRYQGAVGPEAAKT